MAETAKANGVVFVDLYHPMLERYARPNPLTINGVHLNEAGNAQWRNRRPGPVRRPPAPNVHPSRSRSCQAIVDRDFYWFNRYRTVDGYSIYGGRATRVSVNNQTNKEVCRAKWRFWTS